MARAIHRPSPFGGNRKIGSATTYIYVDTTNDEISIYVGGVLQKKWA